MDISGGFNRLHLHSIVPFWRAPGFSANLNDPLGLFALGTVLKLKNRGRVGKDKVSRYLWVRGCGESDHKCKRKT